MKWMHNKQGEIKIWQWLLVVLGVVIVVTGVIVANNFKAQDNKIITTSIPEYKQADDQEMYKYISKDKIKKEETPLTVYEISKDFTDTSSIFNIMSKSKISDKELEEISKDILEADIPTGSKRVKLSDGYLKIKNDTASDDNTFEITVNTKNEGKKQLSLNSENTIKSADGEGSKEYFIDNCRKLMGTLIGDDFANNEKAVTALDSLRDSEANNEVEISVINNQGDFIVTIYYIRDEKVDKEYLDYSISATWLE